MLAAIDAGSNTLRLLVGETDGKTVTPYSYHRRITRLAGGFSEEEGLSREARERTLSAFQAFAATCQHQGVTTCKAVGTAAFRKSVNGQAFVEEIQETCGITLRIIDGDEEASLMTAGVLSALNPIPKSSLIIDIGGGSTEFVLCADDKVLWQKSISLGVVTLTEKVEPEKMVRVIDESIQPLLADMNTHLSTTEYTMTDLQLVGTAGTVTTLAALDLQMSEYDWRRVNNYKLDRDRITYWQSFLCPLSPTEREQLAGMEEGRGDLILAGIKIISAIMKQLNFSVLTVSDFGILEGLLLSLANSVER